HELYLTLLRYRQIAEVREHSINGKMQFLVLSHSSDDIPCRRGRAPSPLMDRQRRNDSTTAAYHEWLFATTSTRYRGLVGSKKRGSEKLRRILHGRAGDEKMSNKVRGRRRRFE
ncbi:MAG: hypothetical protein GY847_12270, partial [Proteobacteria bacterium]|nr:hypothetical protein [Pseudomonadota bacterium]